MNRRMRTGPIKDCVGLFAGFSLLNIHCLVGEKWDGRQMMLEQMWNVRVRYDEVFTLAGTGWWI